MNCFPNTALRRVCAPVWSSVASEAIYNFLCGQVECVAKGPGVQRSTTEYNRVSPGMTSQALAQFTEELTNIDILLAKHCHQHRHQAKQQKASCISTTKQIALSVHGLRCFVSVGPEKLSRGDADARQGGGVVASSQ